jgi:hypothetical protein
VHGLLDINAVTGAKIWSAPDASGTQADSTPAIAGAPRSQIVAYADLTGRFTVDSVASVVVYDTSTGVAGASRSYEALPLWSYPTKAGIVAPPVILNGAF